MSPIAPSARPKSAPHRRVLVEWAVVALLSTAVVVALVLGGAAARPDNLVYDALSKLSVRPPDDRIVIVAIDNRSIQALGRWPWPRAYHSALLHRLAPARPAAIAYDVLFVDPDSNPDADASLAEAVRSAAPVFLPLTFDVPGDNGAPFRAAPPVEPVRSATAGVGNVDVAFDPDGVVRRVFLAEGDQSRQWPHLMERTARASLGHVSAAYLRGGDPVGSQGPANGLVRHKPLLISFTGPPGHFRTISFIDAMRGETPPQFLDGKLVLVGATADGLGDRYATPLSGGTEAMPGVELQANLLDTLLGDRAITPLGRGATLAVSLTPMWILLIGFLFLRPRTNMLLGAALAVAALAAAASLLLFARIWAPPSAAFLGLALVYPLWSWRRLEASSAYMIEELRQFAKEPDFLPSPTAVSSGPPSDMVGRQMELMRRAVGRARNLRSFVTDALRGLPDATLVAGLDDHVLLANRRADLLFEGLVGRRPTGSALVELLSVLIPEPFSDPQPAEGADFEIEVTSADGRAFSVCKTTLTDSDGQTVGWIVRLTDISPQKAASRQREQILQLLTHDMRSPQVSILSLIDGAETKAIQPGLAQRIEGYARRTLSLADNFVHLARAETEHYALETVDLADVLIDAVDALWPQSTAKRIVVGADTGDGEYLVQADRSLLTRALINLVDNAIKYTDPGGRVDCRLQPRPSPAGDEIVCTIKDTGRGMSPEQMAHLFEPFRNAASTPGAKIDSVGLGLAFVQTVLLRHGGAVTCESKPEEGSTFTVSLPLDRPDADA